MFANNVSGLFSPHNTHIYLLSFETQILERDITHLQVSLFFLCFIVINNTTYSRFAENKPTYYFFNKSNCWGLMLLTSFTGDQSVTLKFIFIFPFLQKVNATFLHPSIVTSPFFHHYYLLPL